MGYEVFQKERIQSTANQVKSDANIIQQPTNVNHIIQMAAVNPGMLTAKDIIQMQKICGNKAVNQLLNSQSPQRINNTGMPDDLKTGIESLSGIALDDVKVHYNSSSPTEMYSMD
jgi:hypothetical protein